ncbi:MAG: hypothetical protein IJ466_07375 [Clostridia bacterium]|nr:hypothetical protein [Clostridia bacterium]
MADTKVKHAFGAKENIEAAKAAGTLNEFDVLHLNNGEIGWIDKNGETVINTPRTQQAHTLNGTSIGALQDGDTVPEGVTIDEFVKLITEKAVPATYTKPTIAIANNGGQASGNVEAGTSITPKLKATFTQNDAGELSAISILKGSTAVAEDSASPLTYEGEELVIGDETISFKASATYGDAPVKNNNLGAESKENWFAGGAIESSAYSISGKRNLFYGCGAGALPEVTSDLVRGLANKKLNPAAGTAITINVEIGQRYIVFAYPATLRDVNNVTYVEANDPGMALSFTKHSIDVADARGGENGLTGYKVYTYEMAVAATAAMTFKVSI